METGSGSALQALKRFSLQGVKPKTMSEGVGGESPRKSTGEGQSTKPSPFSVKEGRVSVNLSDVGKTEGKKSPTWADQGGRVGKKGSQSGKQGQGGDGANNNPGPKEYPVDLMGAKLVKPDITQVERLYDGLPVVTSKVRTLADLMAVMPAHLRPNIQQFSRQLNDPHANEEEDSVTLKAEADPYPEDKLADGSEGNESE